MISTGANDRREGADAGGSSSLVPAYLAGWRELLFQKKDNKSLMWARALQRRGLRAEALDASPVWLFAWLLIRMFRRGRPVGFVFRYLNDYPSVSKTLLRMASEIMMVVLCWIARIPIFWICHNVDRESVQSFGRVTALRRWVVGKASERIFVTDPLLMKYAERYLGRYGAEFDYVTFGAPGAKAIDTYSADINRALKEHCDRLRAVAAESGRRTLIGLCVGDDGPKYTHFSHVLPLIYSAARMDVDVFMIVGGNLGEVPGSFFTDETIKQLRRHPNVWLHQGRFEVDERMLGPSIDFFWRGYRDISVAYTLYVAAAAQRPILALASGFVGEAVDHYNLGATVQPDMSNLAEAFARLHRWDPKSAERFLEDHTWDVAADRMMSAIRSCVTEL